MEGMDAQMLALKQQAAAARGYKGHLTKVTKRVERAKDQLDNETFQEAQACNDNLADSWRTSTRRWTSSSPASPRCQ